MKMIDADALIEAHYEACLKDPSKVFEAWSLKLMEEAPTASPDLSEYSDKLWKAAYERGKAEAQAEIIKCEECIYGRPCKFDEEHLVVCVRGITARDQTYIHGTNWCCADAERREDG